MRPIIIALLLLLSFPALGQFNRGSLKDFNVQMNLSLSRYQLKSEWSPAPKHLLGLEMGYGLAFLNNAPAFLSEYKNNQYKYGFFCNEFLYFTFITAIDYKFYLLKSKNNLDELHNQGFYFIGKLGFNGSTNQKQVDRVNYFWKAGLGYGFNIRLNKNGTVGLDFLQGLALNINDTWDYVELVPMLKASLYIMLFSQ